MPKFRVAATSTIQSSGRFNALSASLNVAWCQKIYSVSMPIRSPLYDLVANGQILSSLGQ